MVTVETNISEEQYKKACFFIHEETADHYLMYQDENGFPCNIWAGRDKDSLENTAAADNPYILKVKGQYTDENGTACTGKGYIFPTSEAWNDLDLEALANGRIEWV